MKMKLLLAFLIVFLVVAVVFFVRINQESYNVDDEVPIDYDVEAPTDSDVEENQVNNDPSNEDGAVPLSELANHDSEDDCWIAYNGKVYDITSYLPRHPGSAAKITPYCGSENEFKNAFEKKHGTSKVELLMKVGTFIGDFDVVGNL